MTLGDASSTSAFNAGMTELKRQPKMRLPEWLTSFLGVNPSLPATDAVDGTGLGLFPLLALWSSLGLVGIALAYNAALTNASWATPLFWLCICGLVLPSAVRIISPHASPWERPAIAIMLGMALFFVRVLHNPLSFTDNDELMHVRTALDILHSGHLFVPNPLLPISPRYPGLEIAATAIVRLAGVPLFVAGMIVIGISRLVFLTAIYALFRRISGSSRHAAVGTVVCMAGSNFVFFESQFAYESMAQALAALSFLLAVEMVANWRRFLSWLPLAFAVSATLAMTHHLTSYFAAGVLLLLSPSYLLFGRDAEKALRMLVLGTIAVASCAVWQTAMGNPTGGYLWPALERGFAAIIEVLTSGVERHLFVSGAGTALPVWQQITVLAATAITGLGLLSGFFRVMTKPKADPVRPLASDRHPILAWGAVLAFLSIGYPICVLLRLSSGSWEIGNRLGSFLFIAAAYLIAASIDALWQGRSTNGAKTVLNGTAVLVLVMGGMISGYGPLIMPGPYLVGADSRSVEPHGIGVAEWTGNALGRDHVFAADRVNRLLLAVHGDQRVVTSLYDREDESPIFFSPEFGSEVKGLIKRLGIEFLLVDRRLTTALPLVGWYYELEEGEDNHQRPIDPQVFDKFDKAPQVDRIFDSGSIVIYDTRAIR